MAENVTLAPLATLQNSSIIATVNANNLLIETAFADCVSLAGTSPNSMLSNLDMNGFNIINLPAPSTVNSPARLIDVVDAPTIVFNNLGELTGSLPAGGSPGNTFISISTSDSSTYGNFQLAGESFTVSNPDGRPDHVMSMGWNIGPNGAPLKAGQPASRIGWESHFDQNGNPSNPSLELHPVSYYNPAGTEFRPITTNFLYNTNVASLNFNAGTHTFFDTSGGNEFLQFATLGSTAGAGASAFIVGATTFYVGNNNYPAFRQNNANASAYLNLPYYDNSNIMQLGAAVSQVASWGVAGNPVYSLTGTGTPANGQLGWQVNFGTTTAATFIGLTVLGSTNFEIKNQIYNSGAGNAVDELLVPSGHAAFVRSGVLSGQTWAAGMNTSSDYEIAAGAQPGGSTALAINHTTQVVSFVQPPVVPTYLIASLPTPVSSLNGARAMVSNGQTSPTFMGTVSSTGTTSAPVFCNGSSWLYG